MRRSGRGCGQQCDMVAMRRRRQSPLSSSYDLASMMQYNIYLRSPIRVFESPFFYCLVVAQTVLQGCWLLEHFRLGIAGPLSKMCDARNTKAATGPEDILKRSVLKRHLLKGSGHLVCGLIVPQYLYRAVTIALSKPDGRFPYSSFT